MANAFPTQQIRGADGIAQGHQAASLVDLSPFDAAANQAPMTVQDLQGFNLEARQQGLKQAMQRWLLAGTVFQTANPNLEFTRAHRKNPAITLGNPATAQGKRQAAGPALPDLRIDPHQPLHASTTDQGFFGISDQATRLPRGIHHIAAANQALRPGGAPQRRLNPVTGFAGRELGSPSQAKLHPCRHSPAGHPTAQGTEIQDRP
ncbi:MAG: hypothetical protein ACO28M_05070, partial [Vulcanococcus sp.]